MKKHIHVRLLILVPCSPDAKGGCRFYHCWISVIRSTRTFNFAAEFSIFVGAIQVFPVLAGDIYLLAIVITSYMFYGLCNRYSMGRVIHVGSCARCQGSRDDSYCYPSSNAHLVRLFSLSDYALAG